MNNTEVISKVTEIVKKELGLEGSGHDWWHIFRVHNLAKSIACSEECNHFIVELAALLHDIADWKMNDGNEEIGPSKARQILIDLEVDEELADLVYNIIKDISFKGAENTNPKTIEAQIVQDADRLDAIGAVGIARTFAYGGFKHRLIHNPEINPQLNMNRDQYLKNEGSTINHFYEKLLLLKDLMNTETGRRSAESRHLYMENYLNQFYSEWNGEDIIGR
ncbi:MAG: HD domain-containing protein [Patescibacteria group bacterium]